MKKAGIITTIIGGIFTFIAVLQYAWFLFANSDNTSSVGIIGGADGPTAIFVTASLPFCFVFKAIAFLGINALIVGIILLITNACKKR